jgi:hydroxybutyrate-dimer hydrolase
MLTKTSDPGQGGLRRLVPLGTLIAAALAGCGGGGGGSGATASNLLPTNVTQLSVTVYPATTPGSGSTAQTQDLLTGGIGATQLGDPPTGPQRTAPTYADPANPTALELRRNALFSNYRGLVDPSPNGGYGRFYGPNVDISGNPVPNSEGMVPGREYIALLDDGTGFKHVVMAVQIPDSFNPAASCLVVGPSSGSRGVYGAIATAGEWGLKHGCAVALTDAGKGIGLHNLQTDTVNRIDGTRTTRAAAGNLAQFAANVTDSARTAFNTLFPNRYALKHAHSQQNPEKDWGNDTLAAARYAFFALNDRFGTVDNPLPITPANTVVIAGSASNGGAAVLRAAELDTTGLIDGVVASEPVIEMPTTTGYGIRFGATQVTGFGKTLADQVTWGNLYQPCAELAPAAALTEPGFFNFMGNTGMNPRAQARCASLAAKGLVTGTTLAAQSADALSKLHDFGWGTESDQMHNSYWGLGNGPILSAMYPNAYGRFSVLDHVCDTSFAVVDATGTPVAIGASTQPLNEIQSFAVANGTANGTPVTPVYDDSKGGPKAWQFAVSASTSTADFGLDTALCQRALVTGADPVTGFQLSAGSTPTLAQSQAVQNGIREATVSGKLGGKPTIIVAGRSDALVPVNDNERAYVAFNQTVDGAASNLRYIEVTNGQHFDTFIPLAGFDTRFIPLHVYFNQAMDMMLARLRASTALPPSQVVRTTPRGGTPGAAPALTAANIPPITATPAAGDRITFSGTSVAVPQ